MDELPCQVPAPLANCGSLAGSDHTVWVGETGRWPAQSLQAS